MKRNLARLPGLAALAIASVFAAGPAADLAPLRKQIAALGDLKSSPIVYAAEGFVPTGTIQPIFFEGLSYQGKPTRVFAWLGLPANRSGKVPGVVLVHGGGGTAFKEWVQKWNEQGFAAISIAVEGQTDERIPEAPRGAPWKRHANAGPARNGIYGDSAETLTDQWMYHAVSATILANSLLRSLPEVDATRVGVCGISWGGIITSTVVGIDPRFAFGIPIYGSGALDRAPNQYGRALKDQAVYREVWEPLLRLPRATMPLLWLTGPRDAHFPLDVQQASYRAAAGPRLVSVPFDMKHGHPPGWNPPDSYAFAKSIVETGRPWAREMSQEFRDGTARVAFETTRTVNNASLIFKRDADWEQAPAKLAASPGRATASASVPAGTSAYYVTLDADGLTLSSEVQSINPAAPPRVTAALQGFNWDRVPLNLHFGKRTGDLTDAEIDFVASHSTLIALEKSHGVTPHGSTEAGIADSARRITQRNPDAKVLFYLNAFINWPGYEAFKTYRPEWILRTASGEIVTHPSGTPRPDPSNADFREWWSEVVAHANRTAPLGGVFVDALPQALSPGLAKQVGDAKARAIVAGLREMLALTKRKLGPDRLVLVNGLRTTDFHEILDWEGIDGVMIEHFGAFKTDSPTDIKADLDSVALAVAKGKFVVVKGWPGFNWLDKEMMQRPYAELLQLARSRLTFPLACFLVAAQPGSHFCYSWGYTDTHGMLDAYAEFDRPLGPPKADAIWQGLTATREFAHASVWVDLTTKQARIEWR